MEVISFIFALGAMGIFPSRAFIPAFITVFLLKFGADIPIISQWTFFQDLIQTENVPAWLVHDVTFIVLGVLSFLELLAQKNQDIRQLLNEFDQYVKPVVAALVAFGLIQAGDARLIEAISRAGITDGVIPLLAGGGVWVMANLRAKILTFLADMDPDDALGLQGLISWLEDGYAVIGVVILLAFPLVMLGMTAAVGASLVWIGKVLEKREAQWKIPCARCRVPIFAMSRICHSCGSPNPSPVSVGFWGQPRTGVPANPATHPFQLVEKKRCPDCAEKLKKRTPFQICSDCGYDLSADETFFGKYLKRVDRRLPMTLLVTAGLSLLPIVGIIPGILYYQFRLIVPLRAYIPAGRGFAAKWAARIVCFLLLMFQWVPAAGGLVLPLMAIISYGSYRFTFHRLLLKS